MNDGCEELANLLIHKEIEWCTKSQFSPRYGKCREIGALLTQDPEDIFRMIMDRAGVKETFL